MRDTSDFQALQLLQNCNYDHNNSIVEFITLQLIVISYVVVDSLIQVRKIRSF
jgi:hypothetical protein